MNNYKNIKAKVLRIDEEEHKFVIEVENRIYKVGQIDFQRRQLRPPQATSPRPQLQRPPKQLRFQQKRKKQLKLLHL